MQTWVDVEDGLTTESSSVRDSKPSTYDCRTSIGIGRLCASVLRLARDRRVIRHSWTSKASSREETT